jgi:lysophospholipase L1-like esterase
LGADGRLIGFRNDGIHPNEPGYEIWTPIVADTLKGWVKQHTKHV